jgi:hypothetical protein
MGLPPPPPPPFPIPVDRFVEECDGDDPAQAAQCCAAFATLATQVPVPRDFRGATRTLMELVERTGDGFGRLTKESATAAMAALLATVPGADKNLVNRGVVDKLVAASIADEEDETPRGPAAADQEGGGSPETKRGGVNGMGSLTLNSLECIRILAASEHGVPELMRNDGAMAFATKRCDDGDPRIAEGACDFLCALAKGLARHGKGNPHVGFRALLGLAMTCAQDGEAQAELVNVPGVVQALLATQRSDDAAMAGIAKDLWGSIGKNPELKKVVMEALRADVERAKAAESA